MWGKVAGPRLPSSRIALGDFFIGPIRKGTWLPPEPATGLSMSGSTGHSAYAVTETFMKVSSPCYLCIDVSAPTDDAAIAKVRERHVPLLLIALSIQESGYPYRIQIFGAQNATQGIGAGAGLKFAYYEDAPLGKDRAAEIATHLGALHADPKRARPARLLARAVALEDAAFADPAIRAAAVLTYFQVIESIATSLPWEPPADHQSKQERIVSRLSQELTRTTSVTRRVEVTRKAVTELNRLDATYLSFRIAHAAETLGLPHTWRSRTEQLHKLRNTKMSHPSDSVSTALTAPWLQDPESGIVSALHLAKIMLEAYVLHTPTDGPDCH